MEDESANTESDNFSIGGFGRYTHVISDTFAVFGQVGAGYRNQEINNVDGDGMYVRFTPALFINFKNSFGVNISIGGISYETLNFDNVDTSSFNFNFGQTVNIGISKNFNLGGGRNKEK